MNESKPAIKSVGIVANVGSTFGGVLLLLQAVGYVVPEPITASIIAAATVVSNLLGIFGRMTAKQKIDGIFFQK